MPIYEYQCNNCSEIITRLRPIAERHNLFSCPICNGDTQLLLSTFSTPKHSAQSLPSSSISGQTISNSRADKSGIYLNNALIENCNVGISMPKNANIDMQEVAFKNVNTPVEIRENKPVQGAIGYSRIAPP